MKHIKLIAGLLSLLACLPLAATAQNVTASGSNLILGFRASGGTGAASNLEVVLGSVNNFTTGTNTTAGIHLVANLSPIDLSGTYGSSWNTRSDLTWGIAAATGVSKTLYATFAESIAGTAFPQGSIDVQIQALRDSAGGVIQSVPSGLNGNYPFTVNSSTSAIVPASDGSSWTSLAFASPGAAFGFFDTSTFENNTTVSGGSYVVSDLYKFTTADTALYIGSFALNSAGQLFFSTTASDFAATPVPEPSTYAAIAGVLALGVVAWRRQQKKVAV